MIRILSIRVESSPGIEAEAHRESRMSEASLLVSTWVLRVWANKEESRLINITYRACSIRVWRIRNDLNKSTQSINTFGTIIYSQVPQLRPGDHPRNVQHYDVWWRQLVLGEWCHHTSSFNVISNWAMLQTWKDDVWWRHHVARSRVANYQLPTSLLTFMMFTLCRGMFSDELIFVNIPMWPC